MSEIRIKTEVSKNRNDKNISSNSSTEEEKQFIDNFKNKNSMFKFSIDELNEKLIFIEQFESFSKRSYRIKEILSSSGGEGVIVRCLSDNETDVVAKIYNDFDYNNEDNLLERYKIIKFTQNDNAKNYVLPIIDEGLIELDQEKALYFEIEPFCIEGDLYSYLSKKGSMTFEQIKSFLSDFIETLHFIHEHNVLHMDVKPENIFKYKGNYVLGDFGIARITNESGSDVTQITHVGKNISGTPGYRPIEALYGRSYYELTSAVDYYALAVTIAYLFLGKFPFKDEDGKFNSQLCQDCADHSHINLGTKDGYLLLNNVVDGLYQKDAKHRFGYEDVKKWLDNPNYKVQCGSYKDFVEPFKGTDGKIYKNCEELYYGLAENWIRAIYYLYYGLIAYHFKINNDAELCIIATEIVEKEYPDCNQDGDIALFEFCVKMFHDDAKLIWKGRVWDNLGELADEIEEASDEKIDFYINMLQKKIVSAWLKENKPFAEKNLKLITDIENASEEYPNIAIYWFSNIFSNKKAIKFDNMEFESIEQLILYIVENPCRFYFDNMILSQLLDIYNSRKIYGFLCAGDKKWNFGPIFKRYIPLLYKSKGILSAYIFLFCFLEEVSKYCESSNSTMLLSKVRNFYYNFGPFSDYKEVYELVRKEQIYECPDKKNRCLEEISNYCLKQGETISEITTIYGGLKEHVDFLRNNMQNNPFLTSLEYRCSMLEELIEEREHKIFRCNNLKGFFMYDFLGRKAPLSLESKLKVHLNQ